MACITDHYRAAAIAVAEAFTAAVDWLTPSLGKPGAIAVMCAVILALNWITFQAGKLLVPPFVKWWYDETITHKAREYVRRKCPGAGMTVNGAKVSFILGFGFFFLARFLASFPMYYHYSGPAFVLAFLGVALIGYFVAGNVPAKAAARYKYIKRFQGPSITGAGLGLASVVFEFLLEAGILAVRYVQVT